jgi:serine/threonine-protein kinase
MNHIFLSYKSDDRARVAPLVEALAAEGLTVWWDAQIEGGAAWRQTIATQLETAACVIVVWSRHSVGPEGHFVQDEATWAQRRGVYLPVAIDAVAAPLGFGQQQVLDLIGWRGGRADPRFTDVAAAARAVISRGPRPIPLARARRRTAPWGPWILVGGAAALILLAVGGLWLAKAPSAGCAGGACGAPTPAAPAQNSIAVLPFANLSGDPSQDYFSDGLSEELISTLARLPPLHVVGRTSSFQFKGSHEGSGAIGAKLGVAFLLDGSVRRAGAVVRVSTQLVDAKTGFERWSQTYDRDMKDIFAVQSSIAQAVAEALKIQLLGGDIAALSKGGTTSPEAYDAYLRGRRLFDEGAGEAGYRAALARFDAAIAADPKFAAAYARRASTLLTLAIQFTSADKLPGAYAEALASARRGVDLAPNLAETQTALASVLIYGARDFAGARQAYARALAVGGGDANVLLGYGQFNCNVADCAVGLAALKRAVALDPLNARTVKTLGLAYYAMRRYPDAVDAMRRTLALSPSINIAHGAIGDALLLQGQTAAAAREFALEPSNWMRLTGQAIVARRQGDLAGANAALTALLADGGDANAYQIAEVRAQWGDRDGAIAALDTAIRLQDAGVLQMKTDPLLDPIRGDPRFRARLAALGLG